MKALRALVSRGMAVLGSLGTSTSKPTAPQASHTIRDGNVKCECWGCTRKRAANRPPKRWYRDIFEMPRLTGLRLARTREACSEIHLTVLPRYSGASIYAVPPIEGAPTAKQMVDIFGLDIGGPRA